MKRVLLSLIIVALVATGVFAAGKTESLSPGVTDSKIVFGYTMPMSGPVGFIGNQTLESIKAEFNRVNDDGGIHGRKLEVIAYDSGMDVSQAVANYRRLITEDKVFALLFGFGGYTRPAYPLIEQNKIPWLFPMAPPEDMMFPAREYLFSLFPTTATQVRTMAAWLESEGKFKRISVIYGDSASGKTGLDRFLLEAKNRNLNVVASEAIVETSPSAAVQIAKIRQANPDLVVIIGMTMQPAAVIIKEIRRTGMDSQIMVNMPISNSVMLSLIADDQPEGIIGCYWGEVEYSPDRGNYGTPEMQSMADALIKYYPDYAKVGSNIGGSVEHGLSVRLLTDALKKAGPDLTREKLIQTLESFKGYPTGKGSYATFSPTRREGVAGGIILEVKNGWWEPISDWIDVTLPEN
ncbi:MAG: ABC transporter substrate-binding protein [Sphaerochaeta sp.]|nr:ABC transporter substrate-binding protein [Sphaerochaeta sp.]